MRDSAKASVDLNAVFNRASRRILPFLFISFIVAFLDRVNIGFAQLQMKGDLGFNDAVYGLGAGIFFLGYFAFEIPSNLILERIGARLTFTRIMICWGIVSACTAFVSAPWQLYVMRFLLGAFEAGFFPGIVLYLTYWFPAERRAGVVSWIFVAVALAGMIGGVLSGAIMEYMQGSAGLAGWQWMFILEGLPAVALGIVAYCILDDHPCKARWLTDNEKAALERVLAEDQRRRRSGASYTFKDALANLRAYVLASVYFMLVCGTMAIAFWLPTLIKGVSNSSVLEVGLLSAIPYGIGAIGIVLLSMSSDARQERRIHYLFCAIGGGLSLLLLPIAAGHATAVISLLSIAVALTFAALPIFWSVPQEYLKGNGAAGGIALISSLGQLGSFLSPTIIGWLKQTTGQLDSGLYALAFLLMASGLTLFFALRRVSIASDLMIAPRTWAGLRKLTDARSSQP
jgi:D-galactonate transporter